MKVLVIDVGGSRIKMLCTGERTPRRFDSGPKMTPKKMLRRVSELTRDWDYEAVSIGYPGLVVHGRIAADPVNLGRGWAGFDFAEALQRPVRVVNDATMQALGGYHGGSLLFLGLGTGLGSSMIVDGHLEPMELAHLPYKKGGTYEDYVGARGLLRWGKKKWRKHALDIIERLRAALEPDHVVVGGGNARKLGKTLPDGVERVDNANAFAGGFLLWTPKYRK